MNSFLSLFLALQKAQIKIINIGFNRKIFNYSSKKDVFVAENSSRNTYFSIMFYGLLSFGMIDPIIRLFENNFTEFNLIEFIIFFAFGILGLRKLLWLLRGKEIMTLKNKLIIEKKGTFWTKKKEYDLSEINNIKGKFETKEFLNDNRKIAINKLLIKETIRVFWYFTIGEIEFEYNGRTIKLFNNLNNKEIQLIINEINKRKTTYNNSYT